MVLYDDMIKSSMQFIVLLILARVYNINIEESILLSNKVSKCVV